MYECRELAPSHIFRDLVFRDLGSGAYEVLVRKGPFGEEGSRLPGLGVIVRVSPVRGFVHCAVKCGRVP